jgi:predicted phage baseplate assembly protein
VQAERLKDAAFAPAPAPTDVRPHYAAHVVWEYHAGNGVWKSLQDVEDDTRALSLSGFVRFKVPVSPQHAAGGIGTTGQSGFFFIRCRLTSGTYDCPPRIKSILQNALQVRHAVDTGIAELKPRSNGQAGQTFAVGPGPVVPGSTRLEITLDGTADLPWHEASSWDAVGPYDRIFVVSYERGEIAFGDGRIGRVPAAGAVLRAKYQIGGGPSGNVPAGTLIRLGGSSSGDVTIRQPFAAVGGEEAEDVDGAISRALAALAAPTRAVTLQDIEDLTLAVPGVPVARAHALADYDPDMPCVAVPASVTVVVVPRCPATRPEPTSELLRTVACYLERRRMLTTELHVVGPCFTTVSIQARLHPEAEAETRKLVDAASAALNEFLDPLRGGPDKKGWPIGRNVYRAEVMALLNDLPGVRYVDDVSLQIGDEQRDRCGNASVCCHGLVTPGRHQITIDSGSDCQ